MQKYLTKITGIILILIFVMVLGGCKNGPAEAGQYTEVAKCLTEKGVKFYGTYWCGHCTSQKKAFGDDFRYITYIECDANGKNGNPEACIEAGIQAYPSWYFPGQGLEVGAQSIDTLAKKANCEDALNPSSEIARVDSNKEAQSSI